MRRLLPPHFSKIFSKKLPKWCDLVDADCGAWYTDVFAPYNDDPITVGMLHRIANAISDDTSARHYSPPEEVFSALFRIANLY